MSQVDPCDPVEAYVRPIRSVLFIDDQFPTFAQTTTDEAVEAERARALWKACTERGWLCDVDNSASWISYERQRRLASCDLLVLDYHLMGDDSGPALSIIRDLARSATPNLVVVYTKDPELDNVLLAAASWARGVGTDAQVPEDLEDLEDSIEWSLAELIAFLSDNGDWKAPLKSACEKAGINMPQEADCSVLLERKLRRDYKVAPSPEVRRLERMGHIDHRWFQCGNLFLVVVGKPQGQNPHAEAEAFFGGLEHAVLQWNPPWLACLMAHSRRRVEAGAFRDDVRLPDEPLQKGLLEYISDSRSDQPERDRRAREIATHLLSRRSADAAIALGGQLQVRAASHRREGLTESDVLYLNAFLCSEPFSHHHLHVGTIFVHRAAVPQYWVCVTPACDMVPRPPDERLNPWAFELDTFKPMVAIRLKLLAGASEQRKALKAATRARHVFFLDRVGSEDQPIIASCFHETDDPYPQVEQLVAVDRARVQEDGSVRLYRCVAKKDAVSQADQPVLQLVDCEPVAQLRAPYAERVVQVVGGHVSRIGVDFVPFRQPK